MHWKTVFSTPLKSIYSTLYFVIYLSQVVKVAGLDNFLLTVVQQQVEPTGCEELKATSSAPCRETK